VSDHEHGSCREILQNLSAFIENDLEGTLRTQVESHLADCNDCRHCAEELRSTILLLGDAGSRPTEPGRHDRLMSRLRSALSELE
jgi:anti-sigma factor RsiW